MLFESLATPHAGLAAQDMDGRARPDLWLFAFQATDKE